MREFALERLADAGEEAATRNRHLARMLPLAEALGQARQALRALAAPA